MADNLTDLPEVLREHAARIAGGGPADSTYDPETLTLEFDAADEIDRLRQEVDQLRSQLGGGDR
jgi:hypothetical protein